MGAQVIPFPKARTVPFCETPVGQEADECTCADCRPVFWACESWVITDKKGQAYVVVRKPGRLPFVIVLRIYLGTSEIAFAVVDGAAPRVTDVVIYNPALRRRGIGSALYRRIEIELGRPLLPSRVRTKAGRAFWRART
jgi:hypothetical protein